MTLLMMMMMTAIAGDVPDGWQLAGSHPKHYEVEVVPEANTGDGSARLEAQKGAKGFGTLMQISGAAPYLGKRVRMTGYVKAESVEEWAGLWLRIDGQNKPALMFDNMSDRPITGDSSWNRYEIVLDVPKNSSNLAYGILLMGEGTVWLDDLSFDIVPDDTPLTGVQNTQGTEVINGSFESF